MGKAERVVTEVWQSAQKWSDRERLLLAVVAATFQETDAEEFLERMMGNSRRYGKVNAMTDINSARAFRRDAVAALKQLLEEEENED